jgi:ubiquinone biosynthesis protein
VLLQKTLLNVEGLGKQLYPELDLWQTALPFLEDWQRQRLSPLANLRKLKDKLPEWLEELPELPELMHETLHEARYGRRNLQAMLDSREARRDAEKQLASKRRLIFGLLSLGAAGLVSLPGVDAWLQPLSPATLILLTTGVALLFFHRVP